jgi:hypothetical protein
MDWLCDREMTVYQTIFSMSEWQGCLPPHPHGPKPGPMEVAGRLKSACARLGPPLARATHVPRVRGAVPASRSKERTPPPPAGPAASGDAAKLDRFERRFTWFKTRLEERKEVGWAKGRLGKGRGGGIRGGAGAKGAMEVNVGRLG